MWNKNIRNHWVLNQGEFHFTDSFKFEGTDSRFFKFLLFSTCDTLISMKTQLDRDHSKLRTISNTEWNMYWLFVIQVQNERPYWMILTQRPLQFASMLLQVWRQNFTSWKLLSIPFLVVCIDNCFQFWVHDAYLISAVTVSKSPWDWLQAIHLNYDPTRHVNTLRRRQNGRHFPDDIFKWIFLNENVIILSKISLKFVPRAAINNVPALVQIMVWCRTGDKPLSEQMMVSLLRYMCHSASVSWPWLNVLNIVAMKPTRQ